ncbi:MAG: chromosome partitioning protein ParB [Clostridiales bacterium GWF2_38_85]|nr:MAG: chromosome partitioning protein ParB [Clostridiales bacterium GWF2_38_85]
MNAQNTTKTKAKAAKIPLEKLHPFDVHPYKVRDDEEMETLADSIRENGILTPLIVRPLENTTDEYEVISGHRRLHAAEKAGITEVPALIYALDRDAAAIALVDSNLHREHILPSEKAFTYKLKMDALNHQGITCGQVGHKSREDISDTESGRQIQRYIRLTNLIPQILEKVDDSRIAFTPAVEISYLAEQEQRDLLDTMESEDCTPSLSQAQRLKRLSQEGHLNMDVIFAILTEEKANQKEKLKIPVERVRDFFPKDYTAEQMEETIVKMCEEWYRKKMRDHDAR